MQPSTPQGDDREREGRVQDTGDKGQKFVSPTDDKWCWRRIKCAAFL